MSTRVKKPRSIHENIRRRISKLGAGTVVRPTDFLNLGPRSAVDKSLSRLAHEGTVQRVRRGIYYCPRVNDRLGLLISPSSEVVAQAWARGNKLSLQIGGAEAANILGLSEQVPARKVYLTDAGATKLKVENQTIELRHASPRTMRLAGYISGTVVQALRHIGKDHVTAQMIEHLGSVLTQADKETVSRHMTYAPGWMQPLLSRVASGIESKGN